MKKVGFKKQALTAASWFNVFLVFLIYLSVLIHDRRDYEKNRRAVNYCPHLKMGVLYCVVGLRSVLG